MKTLALPTYLSEIWPALGVKRKPIVWVTAVGNRSGISSIVVQEQGTAVPMTFAGALDRLVTSKYAVRSAPTGTMPRSCEYEAT